MKITFGKVVRGETEDFFSIFSDGFQKGFEK